MIRLTEKQVVTAIYDYVAKHDLGREINGDILIRLAHTEKPDGVDYYAEIAGEYEARAATDNERNVN